VRIGEVPRGENDADLRDKENAEGERSEQKNVPAGPDGLLIGFGRTRF
jgi:hypothetical protein